MAIEVMDGSATFRGDWELSQPIHRMYIDTNPKRSGLYGWPQGAGGQRTKISIKPDHRGNICVITF